MLIGGIGCVVVGLAGLLLTLRILGRKLKEIEVETGGGRL